MCLWPTRDRCHGSAVVVGINFIKPAVGSSNNIILIFIFLEKTDGREAEELCVGCISSAVSVSIKYYM